MGTPDEICWPGVSQLPDYKPTFPKWTGSDFKEMFPKLEKDGMDLLLVRFWVLQDFGLLKHPDSISGVDDLRPSEKDFREEGTTS